MDKNNTETWVRQRGLSFLTSIGIQPNQTVLDFGCGEGMYSIPAAKVVGDGGRVYAVDNDRTALDKLVENAKSEGLKNIISAEKREKSKLELKDVSVDTVLLYDVLHYLDVDERKRLYGDIYRILKDNGLLSVYPKHNKQDWPMWHLSELELLDVIDEIELEKFYFEKKSLVKLIHDYDYDEGYILSFRKTI